LDQKEIAMIEAIVEYYNWIFSTINRNYSFEVKKENEEIPADATIVSFENDALESRVHGRMNPVVFSGGSGNNFINSARIVVDWEKIKTEEDAYIYYVLFHEFTHVLGLGDVYYQGDFKNTQRVELETIMNLENSRRGMNCLYPNDYAVLQALYSNEYNLTKNYEEAVNKVKGKIEEYTKIFYKKYGRYLKEKCGATSKMCEKDVGSKIKWVRENGGKTKWYEIELKKDGKCVFAIKDREGNKLETSEAEYIFVDNVLHIRGIMLENANNYDEYSFSKDLKMKLLLSIYKDEFGELWAYDGMQYWTGVSMTTQINIKTK